MKTYYEMLAVAPGAAAEEIRSAFRRAIARYHPDKVQHLGPEFQDMASGIAADLTEAYRVLMDPTLRATYDERLGGARAAAVAASPTSSAAACAPFAGRARPEPPPAPPGPAAAFDFVRRASLAKLRAAIDDVLGSAETLIASAFDVALVTRPRKAIFRKAADRLCLAAKVAPFVDQAAIAEIWLPAVKLQASRAEDCVVLLLGQGLAPARDLAAAVSDLRRRGRGGGPLVVPVDVRDWEALVPSETPGPVRSLILRLKEEKR